MTNPHNYDNDTTQPIKHGGKKRRKLPWILGGITIVILLICGGCGIAFLNSVGNELDKANTTVAEESPTQTEAQRPAKPAVWAKVTTLSGSANKRGTVFHLTGKPSRLSYTATGNGAMAIYVVDQGASLKEDGGFAEVTLTEAGKDTTQLAKSEGDYYLDIVASSMKWTVVIEELRPQV